MSAVVFRVSGLNVGLLNRDISVFDNSCATGFAIEPVNPSCFATAGASLFTSMSFNFVHAVYPDSFATDADHFGSSAYIFPSCASVESGVSPHLDFPVSLAVRSFTIALYHSVGSQNIVWF